MKRNSTNEIQQIEDLNRLEQIVKDKRIAKRSESKKNRRNRHYQKQFIRYAINLKNESE